MVKKIQRNDIVGSPSLWWSPPSHNLPSPMYTRNNVISTSNECDNVFLKRTSCDPDPLRFDARGCFDQIDRASQVNGRQIFHEEDEGNGMGKAAAIRPSEHRAHDHKQQDGRFLMSCLSLGRKIGWSGERREFQILNSFFPLSVVLGRILPTCLVLV